MALLGLAAEISFAADARAAGAQANTAQRVATSAALFLTQGSCGISGPQVGAIGSF